MSWWPFSSSGSGSNTKAHIQTEKSASISPKSISPPVPAPQDPDFYAAYPHLAPSSFPSNPSNTEPSQSSDDSDFDPTLPRTMSCRAAFDSAFYCSSFGGHFNDIYRHGQLRSCSEHWSDFWFCMRVKNSYSEGDIKERMVQERYREKEEKLTSGPNSEDVWSRRGPREYIVGAFGAREEDGK